jgi:hypothetical protein
VAPAAARGAKLPRAFGFDTTVGRCYTARQGGGLDLTGKAAVLKTAGLTPLGVRVPRPPPEHRRKGERCGEVPERLKGAAC